MGGGGGRSWCWAEANLTVLTKSSASILFFFKLDRCLCKAYTDGREERAWCE